MVNENNLENTSVPDAVQPPLIPPLTGEGTAEAPPAVTPAALPEVSAPTPQATPQPPPASEVPAPVPAPPVPAGPQFTTEQYQQLVSERDQLAQVATQAQAAQQEAQIEAQRQQMVQQAEAATQTFAAQLTNAGYGGPETQPAIDSYRANQLKAIEVEQRAMEVIKNEQGRMNLALQLGKQHSVDPQTLMSAQSPQQMQQMATGNSEVSQLRAEIAEMKQAAVPPAQAFESGATQAGGGESDDTWRLPASPTLEDHLRFATINGLDTTFFEQQISQRKRAIG